MFDHDRTYFRRDGQNNLLIKAYVPSAAQVEPHYEFPIMIKYHNVSHSVRNIVFRPYSSDDFVESFQL